MEYTQLADSREVSVRLMFRLNCANSVGHRLGRLSVSERNGTVFLKTRNVRTFSVAAGTVSSGTALQIHGRHVELQGLQPQGITYFVERNGAWEVCTA